MPFSVITIVWLGEHRAFVVECFFMKAGSYVTVQLVFCKKFKLKTLDSVLLRVTICILRNKYSNIHWSCRKEEKCINSGELWKTANSSRDSTTKVTLLTRFFVTFLTQYSSSNVKAWLWLSTIQTANCYELKETIFVGQKDFCKQFLC